MAAVYARVSSKEQEKEGFSIPAQLKLLRGYAADRRFTVIEEFVDVETAKRTGRPGFTAMVEFFKKHGKAKPSENIRRILLAEKTDRLYRNLKDWVTLDDLDLEIHFVKENVVLARDSRSSEKFMHGIKVLMAKNYIDNLSEEASKGMLEKAEQGFWPSFSPLGYRNITAPNGRKTIEPDPDVAPMVSRLFEWYATGNYSLEDITAMAQTAGLVSRQSKSPLSRGTIHKILRNRIYMGDFEWKGKIHQGVHVPLITRDLWEGVQKVLDHRFAKRHRKVEHDFAFSRLIACGHCGCSLVGEIKKGRYIYYHCTGFKGKCPEPYTREEILEERFADLLKGLVLDDEVMAWLTEALRQSHEDERRYHEEAITRLHTEYTRLQHRIEAMYVDKLDGQVDTHLFDRKAAEWRAEQNRLMRAIEEHQTANQTYLEEGIRLLELGRRAHKLFQKQEPREKRRLLDFVLSNCTWKDGALQVTFRQPFDLIIASTKAYEHKKAVGVSSNGLFENWRAIEVLKANVEPLQGELRYERFGTTSIAAVSILTWLVWCLAERGAFAEGSVCAEEAVRIAEATDYPRSCIQVYFGVGMLHLRKGDLHQAIPVLERGLSICQRVDILGWFVDIAPVLGAAYLRSGRVAEALPLLEQAVERAASMRHMLWHSLRVCWLSEAYLLTGRMDEAIRLAEHALKHAQDRQERGYQAWALRLLGEIHSHQDSQEFGQAETSYHQALALAEELGMRPLVAHCRLGLGTLYGQLGQLAQAGSELSAAIELYRDMEMTFWLTRTEAALIALPPD